MVSKNNRAIRFLLYPILFFLTAMISTSTVTSTYTNNPNMIGGFLFYFIGIPFVT